MINTLKLLISNLIGAYQPVEYQIDGGLTVIPSGMAGVDWEWLGALLLFMLSFYCIFRLVGVILNAIRHE